MENPRFARAAARRRTLALALAILFHVLLLAGLAYIGAGGSSDLFGDDAVPAVEASEGVPLP